MLGMSSGDFFLLLREKFEEKCQEGIDWQLVYNFESFLLFIYLIS